MSSAASYPCNQGYFLPRKVSLIPTQPVRLHYFNFRGLGEGLRLILAQSGLEWEDVRIVQEEWPMLKSNIPMGALPVLELEDGKFISQSTPIALYIAEVSDAGLLPDDLMQRTRALEMTLSWLEFIPKMTSLAAIQDKAIMMKKYNETMETFVEPKLQQLEMTLDRSFSGFVTDSLTYADFMTYNLLDALVHFFKADLSKYARINQYRKTIESLPRIREYQDKHKDVTFAPFPPIPDRENCAGAANYNLKDAH